ncbi:MAG TPA: FkbM family methyltransferase [Planctomycetota bacterium]|nr:FkbM family methyltransferase [Planctomycetota bacterium]
MKQFIKRLLFKFGYQLRHSPKSLHFDPFFDQAWILKDKQVETIFDVGANAGQTAALYRARFPRAKIISFEPFPESYARCTDASRALQPMEVVKLALAEKSGSRSFFCTTQDQMNSLLKLDDTRKEFYRDNASATRELEVEVATLDGFCAKKELAHIDILKLDIQGGECSALQGASGLLSQGAIDVIYLEVAFAEIYKGQPLFHDVFELLTRHGFVLFDLYGLYKDAKGLALIAADALFIRAPVLEAARARAS